MAGFRGIFGRRNKAPVAPPVATAGATLAGAPVGFRVFPKEVFEGETGEFLREMGFDPDQMGNIIGDAKDVEALLADDFAKLQQRLAALKQATSHEIGVVHLLPTGIWQGPLRDFLVKQLDLSPYRPWNSALFPTTAAGAAVARLPMIQDARGPTRPDLVIGVLEEVRRIFDGVDDRETQAVSYMLGCIRENFPDLFPTDGSGFTDKVRLARANVRALAVSLGGIKPEVLLASHETFHSKPGKALIT